MSLKLFIYTCFLLLSPLMVAAQCFITPNNPIGGNTNMGSLNKKNLRLITFYRHLRLKNFLQGHRVSEEQYIDNAHYDYAGALIGYGISDVFSLETEIGYFIDKRINYQEPFRYTLNNQGFANLVLSAKARLYKDVLNKWEIAASGGVKVSPFPVDNVKDGVTLPINLWTSTESTGLVWQSFVIRQISAKGLRLFLHNRYETNFENDLGYQFGQSLITSFFISKHLYYKGPDDSEPWTIILQLRNELGGKNRFENEMLDHSGSIKFFIGPQVNYTWKENWNFSVAMDVPVYQYYYGTQLAEQFSIYFNIVRDFYF